MLDPFCIGSSLFSGGNSVVDSFGPRWRLAIGKEVRTSGGLGDGPNGGGMSQISLATPTVQGKNFGLREQIMAIPTSGSMTMSGKAISVYDPKPMAYKAVRVWLSDGSRILGMWTGTKWWNLQGEIKPVRWELEERKKKEDGQASQSYSEEVRLVGFGRRQELRPWLCPDALFRRSERGSRLA
jgi:hypothetical protein